MFGKRNANWALGGAVLLLLVAVATSGVWTVTAQAPLDRVANDATAAATASPQDVGEKEAAETRTPPPAAPQVVTLDTTSNMRVVDSMRFNTVECVSGATLFDNVNGYGYFASDNGVIVKAQLADGSRVGALGLEPDEYYSGSSYNSTVAAVLDPLHGYAYFGVSVRTDSAPYRYTNKIVQVRLADFKRVGAISLPYGPEMSPTALIGPNYEFAYFIVGTEMLKLRLSDFTIVDSADDNVGGSTPHSWALDAANDLAYTYSGSGIYKVNLSDMTVEGLSLPGSGYAEPGVFDLAQGFAYVSTYVSTRGGVAKIQLSDMTEVARLEFDNDNWSIPYGAVIVPDQQLAHFLAGDRTFGDCDCHVYRVDLTDFTFDGAGSACYGESNAAELITVNPDTGSVYLSYRASGGGFGEFELSANAENAQLTMLDAANGYAYAYGTLGTYEGAPPSYYPHGTIYGLIKISLDDLTRVGALETWRDTHYDGGGEEVYTYNASGIDTANGDIHLAAFWSPSGWSSPNRFVQVGLSDFTIVGYPSSVAFSGELCGSYDRDCYMMYGFPQGVAYLSKPDFGTSRSVVQGGYISTTQVVTTTWGKLLAVDALHDHLYVYDHPNLLKLDGTDLSVEASLRLNVYFLALDPANDTGYLFFTDSAGDDYYRILRLSDLSVVLNSTLQVPYHSSYPVVIDPSSGYGYTRYGNNLYRFRLADSSVADSLDLGEYGSILDLDLDPLTGAIYATVGSSYTGYRLLEIDVAEGKAVAPAANVPYHSVVTYTITINGPVTQTAELVTLTDTLPAEVDFHQWVEQPSGATVSDDVVRWSGTLTPEQSLSLSFQARHVGGYGDAVVNTAEWGSATFSKTASAVFGVEPFVVRGRVMAPGGQPLYERGQIHVAGQAETAAWDEEGYYEFSLPDGTYVISPSSPTLIECTPPTRTVAAPLIGGLDFVCREHFYGITGTVYLSPSNRTLPGIEVVLYRWPDQALLTTTDDDGQYAAFLRSDGDYTLFFRDPRDRFLEPYYNGELYGARYRAQATPIPFTSGSAVGDVNEYLQVPPAPRARVIANGGSMTYDKWEGTYSMEWAWSDRSTVNVVYPGTKITCPSGAPANVYLKLIPGGTQMAMTKQGESYSGNIACAYGQQDINVCYDCEGHEECELVAYCFRDFPPTPTPTATPTNTPAPTPVPSPTPLPPPPAPPRDQCEPNWQHPWRRCEWRECYWGDFSQQWHCSGLEIFDPSGYVYDEPSLTLNMTQTIPGAMVSLYRLPDWKPKQYLGDVTPYTCQSHLSKEPAQVWDQELSEQEVLISEFINPDVQAELLLIKRNEISPTINPQYADATGHYAWDVAEGCWYVTVHAKGYYPYISPLVGVPPEVTDLHAAMIPYNYLTLTQTLEDVNGGDIASGDVLRYTIHITNTAGISMTEVVVEHSVPLSVTLAEFYPADAITDTNPIEWHIGDLLPGASWTGYVTATVIEGATSIGDSWAAVESEEDRRSTEQYFLTAADTTQYIYMPLILRAWSGG